MHPVQPLQMRDQAVIGRGRQRVPADQQWMKAEHGPQRRIGEVVGHFAEHRAVPVELDHLRRAFQREPEGVERNGRQILECGFVDRLTDLEVAVVGVDIRRIELGHLCAHLVDVAGVIEHPAIIEPDLVERVHRDKVDVVGQGFAAQRPQLFEQIGCGDDRRAKIEDVPVPFLDQRTTAGAVKPFQNRDLVAAGGQPDCGG